MSDIWISVVVPTYNRADSLRVTLDALGRQTFSSAEFEVLVIDDGSTDGTEAMLTGYSLAAPFTLRPLTQTNAGPSTARNRGIDAARGEVIVLIDDDVEPVPEFISAHAARHQRGDIDDRLAVFGPMLRDPRRREPAWIAWEHAMLKKQYAAWETGAWSMADAYSFYSGNASFRREWALAVGGFDAQLKRMEDVDLGLRMQRECGVRFEFDPRPVGIHRPVRSFASWLSVAEAYGRLDGFERVRENYGNRNGVTQALAHMSMAMPWTSAPLRWLLSTSANALHAVNLSAPAMSALSVVYNVRYLQSAAGDMSAVAFRRLLREGRGRLGESHGLVT